MEEILDAAEAVGVERGFDALTTSEVAERAAVSPGSLYQYFANKDAIISALAQRHRERLDQLGLDLGDPALATMEPADIASRVVQPLIDHYLANPALRALLALEASPGLATHVEPIHTDLCNDVEGLVANLSPSRSQQEREIAATTAIGIFKSLLPAILDATPHDRTLMVRELEAALAGYLSTMSS